MTKVEPVALLAHQLARAQARLRTTRLPRHQSYWRGQCDALHNALEMLSPVPVRQLMNELATGRMQRATQALDEQISAAWFARLGATSNPKG